MAPYERPVTGADVIGAAAAFPAAGVMADAVAARLPPDRVVGGLDELAAIVPAEALGISPGAWEAVFGPLFGEFE